MTIKTFIWIHYPSPHDQGQVVAYEMVDGIPQLAITRINVGYRDPIQAVKEELALHNRIPPAERHGSGGKSFRNDHKFFQL